MRRADYAALDGRLGVVKTFALAGDAYRSTGLSSSDTVTLSFGEIEVSLDIDALFR